RGGARFKGYNRRGGARWSNTCEVVAAEPEREVGFRRTAPGAGTGEWRYRLEPSGTGTRLRESYEVVEPPNAVVNWLTGLMLRTEDRDADLTAGMRTTLERLRWVAESGASS